MTTVIKQTSDFPPTLILKNHYSSDCKGREDMSRLH